jgi:putative lipase involved disintegration of autophagic bodies
MATKQITIYSLDAMIGYDIMTKGRAGKRKQYEQVRQRRGATEIVHSLISKIMTHVDFDNDHIEQSREKRRKRGNQRK